MSLASQVTALAGSVRDKFNLIAPRLLPAGGKRGQVLAKTTTADNAVAWTSEVDSTYTFGGFSDFLSKGAIQGPFAVAVIGSGTFTVTAESVTDANHPGVLLLRGATTTGGGLHRD